MSTTWSEGGGGGLALPTLTPMLKRLMLALAGMYFVRLLLPSGLDRLLLSTFSIDPEAWFAAPFFLPIWQPLTYGFLHSTEPFHLIWNLLYLYFFGSMLESLIGSRRFLATFLGGVLVGGLGSLAWKLLLSQGSVTLGASAGCLAVLTAVAVMRPRTPVLLIFIPIPLIWLAGGLVGIDALGALRQIAGESGSQTDHFAHLFGAAFGFTAAKLGWIWVDPTEKLNEHLAARRSHTAQADSERLDDLLRRIHEHGIGSLSDKERAFLKKMSQRG